MFQDNQVLGVTIAMCFILMCIAVAIYFTRNLIAEHKVVFLLVFIVGLLNGMFGVDKIIAFRTNLLTEKESDTILQMDLMIVSMTLVYYMKTEKKSDK